MSVLDWFSRYVVAWELGQTLEMPFVLSAIDQALLQAVPSICNSDQGSHFTSPQYLERLRAKEVQISMDGKGRALDNIFTERLWRTVKYEEVYLHEYDSPRAARKGLSGYFEFYNQARLHQSLGYRTPAEVYFDTTLQRQEQKEVFTPQKYFVHCLDKGVHYKVSGASLEFIPDHFRSLFIKPLLINSGAKV